MSAATVQRLGRDAGNAAVASALARTAVVQRSCGCRGTCGGCGGHEEPPVEDATAQRAVAGQHVVQRAAKIVDDRHLESDLFAGDVRLDTAFHNDPTLTAHDNGPSVAKMQQALDATVRPMPKSRVTSPAGDITWDGRWGGETTRWVREFQTANAIAPGGWEAGRKTLDALDRQSKGRQPKPTPVPPVPPVPPPAAAKVCGPNVSTEVKRVWTAIQNDYSGWGLGTRANACRMMVQPLIVREGKVSINQDAFDTIGLYQPSMGYTHEAPYAGTCGTPAPAWEPDNPFDPKFEDPSGCSNTVQIGSSCWLAGTPNYGTFGIMMRLCHDDVALALLLKAASLDPELLFGLGPTMVLAGAYKAFKHDNFSDPTKWAAATWVGGPAADPGGSNRPDCASSCSVPGPSGTFDYIWETAHGTHG